MAGVINAHPVTTFEQRSDWLCALIEQLQLSLTHPVMPLHHAGR
ncbi:hypothetical protein XAP412_1070041 [Xanthomonas phaseoli pv. phaseoli]|uniref:Transposase n=1 Tax=Xanthomonas campestris pv. phaseoli TaxID=317013 RepID=A0AB38DVG4_XANCH|nr:hypothetical protein XAP412_1070041 [Xanthomonas phaseoli pv. phaseoli]SON76119.1 hypothetical protein XAP6984_1120042 [Xanthomonas phaseoli pv. phaseoli]SON78821.1 hypothetical protein XAP7430_1090042 [Xanthomonas phaseoli pv. phaseoli]SOO30682.1 hypothetical protein XAP6164_4650007 [Xanthomonas phaseoli pv. phaseoli]